MTFQVFTGTVKWFNHRKGFGFIVPTSGDADIYVHASNVGEMAAKLVPSAVVTYRVKPLFYKGDWTETVDRVISVTPPKGQTPETASKSREVWAEMTSNGRNFGFAMAGRGVDGSTDYVGQTVFVHRSIWEKVGIVPGAGMTMKAKVVTGDRGPKATYFQAGPAIDEEYRTFLERYGEPEQVAEAGVPEELLAAPERPAEKKLHKHVLVKTGKVFAEAESSASAEAGTCRESFGEAEDGQEGWQQSQGEKVRRDQSADRAGSRHRELQ